MIVCVSMILAGAIGNVIDCIFYGMIFSESADTFVHFQMNPAHFTEIGKGYGSFLQGRVVDMFFCPLLKSTYPTWVPIVGGESFTFFQFIFNVADSAISVGITIMFIFQSKFFPEENKAASTEIVSNELQDTSIRFYKL
jgi:signal peptidase II